MRLILPLLGMLLLCTPAGAGQTDWQEVLPDVRMRLVAMPYFGAKHDIAAAIEIDMPTTHKTYWRIPGGSGFPSTLDASGSTNVDGVEQMWPLPTIEEFKGETDYVYRGHTYLPFSIRPEAGEDVVIDVSTFLGICAELCMPVQAHFSLRLDDANPDGMQSFGDALSRVPAPWPHEAAPIQSVRVVDGGISLRVMPGAEVDASSIVASTDAGNALGAPVTTADGILLPSVTGDSVVAGDRLQLAFRSGPGFYSIDVTAQH